MGRSSNNAFQFTLDKKSAGRVSYLVSYTWSKVTSHGCDGWYEGEGCSIQDPYTLSMTGAWRDLDLTHILSFSWLYPIPFGEGKRWNDLRADWPRNFDLSLFRVFPATESKRFEFRAEFFSAFNTPLFAAPDSGVGDQHFGEVFSAANLARQIQFALKFYF